MVTFTDIHRALSGTPTTLTFLVAAITALVFYRVVTAVINAAARRQHRTTDSSASGLTFEQSPYQHHSRNH